MNSENNVLSPKLRFPEFQGAKEWTIKNLDDVCVMRAGKFIASSEISDIYKKDWYPCFGGNGLRGYTKNFTHSGKYSLIGRQGALCGNVMLADGFFYATEHALVTTPKEGNSTDWLFYNLCILNLNNFSTGQAQPGLSVKILGAISCAVPPCKEEQQKIADCLSSLDELIDAQNQKLKLLKAHKKALMQHLFPAPRGGVTPRLRFPEFRNKWRVKKLGECLRYQQPTKYLVSDTNYSDSYEIPVLTAGKTFVLGHTNEQHGIFHEGLPVIIFDDFTTATKFVVFPFKAKSSAMKILQVKDGLNIKFMYEAMQTISYKVSSHERHWISKFAPMQISVPSMEEQQKIASCLSTTDELIALQTEKTNTLKSHKIAMMQNLFPQSPADSTDP